VKRSREVVPDLDCRMGLSGSSSERDLLETQASCEPIAVAVFVVVDSKVLDYSFQDESEVERKHE
jgi:hypothetical protein